MIILFKKDFVLEISFYFRLGSILHVYSFNLCPEVRVLSAAFE